MPQLLDVLLELSDVSLSLGLLNSPRACASFVLCVRGRSHVYGQWVGTEYQRTSFGALVALQRRAHR